MTYLQHLLRNQNEEFWALGLAQLTKPGVELFTSDILEIDGSSFDHGHEPRITHTIKSIASMNKRLAELKKCLARTEEFGIPEEIAQEEELSDFFVEFTKQLIIEDQGISQVLLRMQELVFQKPY